MPLPPFLLLPVCSRVGLSGRAARSWTHGSSGFIYFLAMDSPTGHQELFLKFLI